MLRGVYGAASFVADRQFAKASDADNTIDAYLKGRALDSAIRNGADLTYAR